MDVLGCVVGVESVSVVTGCLDASSCFWVGVNFGRLEVELVDMVACLGSGFVRVGFWMHVLR